MPKRNIRDNPAEWQGIGNLAGRANDRGLNLFARVQSNYADRAWQKAGGTRYFRRKAPIDTGGQVGTSTARQLADNPTGLNLRQDDLEKFVYMIFVQPRYNRRAGL